MNLVGGGALLNVVDKVVPPVAGSYQRSANMIITSFAPGQKDLRTAGIKVGIAQALDDFVWPMIIGTAGGGGAAPTLRLTTPLQA